MEPAESPKIEGLLNQTRTDFRVVKQIFNLKSSHSNSEIVIEFRERATEQILGSTSTEQKVTVRYKSVLGILINKESGIVSFDLYTVPNVYKRTLIDPKKKKYAWKLQEEFSPVTQRRNQPSCESRSIFRLSLCLHNVMALSKLELSIEAASLLSAALMPGRNY